jgi:hypothetical protein
MISAQTRPAFVGREDNFTLFRIMLWTIGIVALRGTPSAIIQRGNRPAGLK